MADNAVERAKSAMRSNNYKALKEGFVSNLNGGSLWEINAITFTLPAAVIAWSALQSRQQFFTPYKVPEFIADWLINCGSILFVITLYSSNPLLLNGLLLLPALVSLIAPARAVKRKAAPIPPASKEEKLDPFPVKPFITMYRGSMMIITCAAILAVDFCVFPRRFAKVENWGTSLMDLGVGSFVFSAGVVSARGILKAQVSGNRSSLLSRLVESFKSSLALLALGVVRLLTVKGVDYAEHVTEYGIHWNFFFTLGFLPPFVAVFQSLFALIPSYSVLALLVGILYEAALDFTTLTAFIVTAPRENLFSKNREGIFSFFGYLAIFLAGQGAGTHVLPRETTPAKSSLGASRLSTFRKSIAGKLLVSSLIYSLLYVFSTSYAGLNLRVSRRLANLPYILLVSAFNNIQILIVLLTEKFFFPNLHTSGGEEKRKIAFATSRLLHAFNRNGLAVFLLANLLTGAVNLSMKTIEMGTGPSMVVLMGYMAVLGIVAVGFDIRNISIKI